MAGQGLAGLGSGISEAYFGGLGKQRQDEQERKDKDLSMQLAAYHALMEHDDTPVSEIPNIMDAQAKLLKAPKEFYKITDHMRQAIQQHGQVPSGPEETRQIATPQVQFQLPTGGGQEPSVPVAQVPEYNRPQGPMAGDAPDMSAPPPPVGDRGMMQPTAQAQAYESVSPTVPTEPTTVTMQQTRAYGELSQGEASDYRKSQSYIGQQRAMLDRQAELARINGDHAEVMASQRAKEALDLQEKKNAGRIAAVDRTFEDKKKALGTYDTQAAATADKNRLALELQLRAGGMDATEARERSGTVLAANMSAILDQHKARAERDRAEVKHWANTDAARLVGKGGAATQGMSAEQARTFRANVIEVLPELSAVRGQLEHLKTLQAQGGTPDPSIQARIDELEGRHTALLMQVKSEREKVLAANTSRVPAASQQQGPPPGVKDTQGLWGPPQQ